MAARKKPSRLAHVISDPAEVALRLAKLGLSRGVLVQAGLAGDLQRRTCTHMDAAGTAGYYLWSRALRVLREETTGKHGWHPDTFLNIPVSYNNDESIAVAVSSGDNKTGRNGDDPSTKNVKGNATQEAVNGNRRLTFGHSVDDQGVDFLYLLIDATDDSVWIELSRPTLIDSIGRIDGWNERILIGRINPDGGSGKRRKPQAPTAPVIDVPVRRKTA